LTILVIYYK